MGFYLNSRTAYSLYQNEAGQTYFVDKSEMLKEFDTKPLFDNLAIAGAEEYETYRNQYDVVSISFNDVPRNCSTYAQYISRIEDRLIKDLQRERNSFRNGCLWIPEL